jgi:hypothetical protein
MKNYDATEQAYKNGYDKGYADGQRDALKKGRMIISGCGFDCCSECRKVFADGYLTAMGIKPRMQFNFCPNCGADMRGEEDG